MLVASKPEKPATKSRCKDALSSSRNKLLSFKNSKIGVLLLIYFASYRGYYSRKYEHDFFARKKYLAHVEHKNSEVRKLLETHNKECERDEQIRQEECARTEFAELA